MTLTYLAVKDLFTEYICILINTYIYTEILVYTTFVYQPAKLDET